MKQSCRNRRVVPDFGSGQPRVPGNQFRTTGQGGSARTLCYLLGHLLQVMSVSGPHTEAAGRVFGNNVRRQSAVSDDAVDAGSLGLRSDRVALIPAKVKQYASQCIDAKMWVCGRMRRLADELEFQPAGCSRHRISGRIDVVIRVGVYHNRRVHGIENTARSAAESCLPSLPPSIPLLDIRL